MQNNQDNQKNERKFNLNIDGIGYFVTAVPFDFNNQIRYNVQVNDEDPAVFAWDREMSMFKSLSDDTSVFPDGLTQAINQQLLKTP